ncbi:MAG: PKD domain-containing protein, partial [Bacteroidales bacterium]|nr:PKD domain-containing protein [Bacteroidales bacterium]
MWLWNFDDPGSGVNNLSSQPNPSHTFAAAGIHLVTLKVTNINSCTNTISKQIEILNLLVANFSADTTCLGAATTFTDLSIPNTLPIASWDWDFGDGSAHSTVQNPTHTFALGGTHLVTLTVVNNNGCTYSVSRQVTIGAPPVAAFSYTSACIDNATTFTDYSYTGSGEPIVSWLWKFNDTNGADTSTLQHPVYKYTAQGLYNVTLTVTTASGCPGSITIPVQVFPAPIARFKYITHACANGNVSFQDSSSSYMGAITSWKWEFEPGYISTLKNPYHIFYNTDSSYNVRLVVTDMRGCVDTLKKDVYVPAGLEVAIVDSLACFGIGTWFKPVAPTGDSLIAFQWNFGDLSSGIHNISVLRNPIPSFQTPGSYLVSLTATDTNYCQKTVYHQVDIQKLPVPVFSYTQGNCDSIVHFNASPTGGGFETKTWIWNFGDGESDTINVLDSANTSHEYASSGIYYVTLTVINGNGCSATFSDSLLVKPCLDAIFTEVNLTGCQNQAITFADSSTSGIPITEWFWDFGDDNDSTYNAYQPAITHIFDTSGTFYVKLMISGQTGSDLDSLKVLINPSPTAMFNTADVCLGLPAKFINTSSGNGSEISKYAWAFGDPGTTLNSTSVNNPTYLYKQSGAFNVALIATNPFGCSDTII